MEMGGRAGEVVGGAHCSAVFYCLIRQPWYSGLFGSVRFWSVVVLTQNIAAREMIVNKRNQLHKIFASKFYNCLQLVSKQTRQHILSAPSMASCFFSPLIRNKFPRSILLIRCWVCRIWIEQSSENFTRLHKGGKFVLVTEQKRREKQI